MSMFDRSKELPPQWEPSAEQVEAMRSEWADTFRGWSLHSDEARFILRRQHEREAFVVERIKRAREQIRDKYHPSWAEQTLEQALLHLAKLDAKSEPTLLEAAKALLGGPFNAQANHEHWDALKAAVERAEKNR